MAVGGYIRRVWRQPLDRRRLTTLVLAPFLLLAFAGCGYGSAGSPACATAVLDDWTKGTLGSGYAPDCYEAAIDSLPEDLRAYTTAADDIARAAISANRAADEVALGADVSARQLASEDPAEEAANDPLRTFPTEVAVLAGLLAVLVSCGVAASLIRRRRGR